MAILIPSRNIYEPHNNKILKNVIERVEVNATEVVPDNEFQTTVYNEKFEPQTTGTREGVQKDFQYRWDVDSVSGKIISTHYACSYLFEEHYYHTATIRINKELKNKYISRLYNGTEDVDGVPKERDFVEYSVSGKTTTYKSTGTVHKKEGTLLQDSSVSTSISNPTETVGIIHFPSFPIVETITNTNPLIPFSSKVTGIEDKSTYSITKETEDYFEVKVSFLCEYDILRASGTYFANGNPETIDIPIEGTRTVVEATEITITAYGNTIGIDLQDKSITISEDGKENSKKVFSVSNNELLQTSNYISGTNSNAIEENYRNTLNAYKNGRETATLLCDINEYKDTNGNLAISTKQEGLPMTFNVGDEVIPMVFGAKGKDIPMSQKDGQPKVFVVSSVKPHYDGAVWQEIEIQEKTS